MATSTRAKSAKEYKIMTKRHPGRSPSFARAVARAVVANLNLRGACVGVGHSLGAHALLRAEAADPGTFSSVHAYEPVFVVSADRVPGPPAPPANLAAAASRRRETFESREDALRAYASKPPLSALRRDALE